MDKPETVQVDAANPSGLNATVDGRPVDVVAFDGWIKLLPERCRFDDRNPFGGSGNVEIWLWKAFVSSEFPMICSP